MRQVSLGRITTPWTKDFTIAYLKYNNQDFKNIDLVNNVNYSVISLYNNGLIETLSDKDGTRIVLTDIGIDLVNYLK